MMNKDRNKFFWLIDLGLIETSWLLYPVFTLRYYSYRKERLIDILDD